MTQDEFLMADITRSSDPDPDTVGVLVERRGNTVTLAFAHQEEQFRLTFERLELLATVEGSRYRGGE
jgi:hypothetical protein